MDRDCPRAWSPDSRTEGPFDVCVVGLKQDFSQANAVPVYRVVNLVRDISRERSEGSRRRRLRD